MYIYIYIYIYIMHYLLLFSQSVMSNSLWPHGLACQAFLSFTISQSLLKLMSIESMMPSNHLILLSPSLPAFNLSQHQGLFQWVGPFHQVTKVLELQFHHQSFRWIFRTDFLQDWLVWSHCCQGTLKSLLQQHSSKASILRHLDFFYCPALTSIHDYWKSHSFDYMDLCWQNNVSVF